MPKKAVLSSRERLALLVPVMGEAKTLLII
jgi:hypothetical protein